MKQQPTFHFSDTLDFTAALPLALRGAVELIEKHRYPQRLHLEGTQHVVWAEVANVAASCIVFAEHDDGPYKRIWVWLSYTAPEFRGQGLHKRLFEAVEKYAAKVLARTIEGTARADNKPMRNAAEAMGREGRFITFIKDVGTHEPHHP